MENKGIYIDMVSQSILHSKAVPADNGGIFYIDLPNLFFTSDMLAQFSQSIKQYNLKIHRWFVCEGEEDGLRLCIKIY